MLIAELDPTAASVRFRPVAYQYPQYNNALADGFRTPEKNFREALSWLERPAATRSQRPNGDASSVLLLAEFLVSLVVEFQVLSKDTMAALMESLRDGRVVSTDRHVAIAGALDLNRKADEIGFGLVDIHADQDHALAAPQFHGQIASGARRRKRLYGHLGSTSGLSNQKSVF